MLDLGKDAISLVAGSGASDEIFSSIGIVAAAASESMSSVPLGVTAVGLGEGLDGALGVAGLRGEVFKVPNLFSVHCSHCLRDSTFVGFKQPCDAPVKSF